MYLTKDKNQIVTLMEKTPLKYCQLRPKEAQIMKSVRHCQFQKSVFLYIKWKSI